MPQGKNRSTLSMAIKSPRTSRQGLLERKKSKKQSPLRMRLPSGKDELILIAEMAENLKTIAQIKSRAYTTIAKSKVFLPSLGCFCGTKVRRKKAFTVFKRFPPLFYFLELLIDELRCIVADAVCTEDENENGQCANCREPHNGVLCGAAVHRRLSTKAVKNVDGGNAEEDNAPRGSLKPKGRQAAREELADIPFCEHTAPQAEGFGNVAVAVKAADQSHKQKGSCRLPSVPYARVGKAREFFIKATVKRLAFA